MSETAVFFGSKEWFETAKKKLSEDQELKKATADWEGCMRCIIDCEDEEALKDYTTEDGVMGLLGMFRMLSDEDRLKYKETSLGKLIENKIGISLDTIPETINLEDVMKKVTQLTIGDFKGVTVYAAFEPYHGELKKMDPIAPDAHLDAKFTISGKYKFWKKLCSGQQSIIQLIMSGKMKLSGDLQYLLKRMAAVNALVKVYKSIPLK